MCIKNAMQLSLDGDTFVALKADFDSILARTLNNMETKGASEATITLKLGVSLEKAILTCDDDEPKETVKPSFKHDISSMMQVKDKKSGSMSGDYEMVWDRDEHKYVLREITNGQLTLFDAESVDEMEGRFADKMEAAEEMIEEAENYDPAFDTSKPFGWLRQFVGESLFVTEAMGNYTVRTESNKVVLSSASSEDSPFHCSAEKLAPHVGHSVVCVGYGGENLVNISIECEDCFTVLFSINLDTDEYEESEEDGATEEKDSESVQEVTGGEKDSAQEESDGSENEAETGYAYADPEE